MHVLRQHRNRGRTPVPGLPRPPPHAAPRHADAAYPKAAAVSTAALLTFAAVTFALGAASGNGPRTALSAARGAATDCQPRRAPAPHRQMTEGTTIMSADTTPGHNPDGTGPQDTGPDAEVVDLDAARAARPGPGADDHPLPPLAGEDITAPPVVPVDQPDAPGPRDWLADMHAAHAARRPVVPMLLRSKTEAAAVARFVAAHLGHVSAYHATRAPKYAAKVTIRAPRGAARVVRGLHRWALDLEGHPARVTAVLRNDPETYLKLSRQRDGRVRLRVPLAIAAALAALAAAAVTATAIPPLARLAVAAAAVTVLGILGRPADAPPILDRAVVPHRVEKLTSDIVTGALGALGIAPLAAAIAKNAKTAVAFKAPITRDGPGWRADLDLPPGVTVAEVADRREKLAANLRRSIGCVWPEVDHDQHPGRLILWVGDQDMSKARQPVWPLARHGAADLFKPMAIGTDQRGRIVTVTLMFVAGIIGAIPRMGKTFLLRLLLLIAALDPRAEVHAYDFKGTGDLSPVECVAHRYRAGDDDDDMAYVLADFRGLREELRRRTKVIRGLPRDICPESKVTPELAARKSLRLHPIVIGVDECQVMFEHPKYGKEFEEIATDLVKRGPATGIVLILATQRPDARAIPTGISANAVLRMCLKVMGQVENDMVLGTSAYKNGTRATMFGFGDKGIFYLAGEGAAPRIVRSFYIDAPAAEKITARARGIRQTAGTLTGHAAGESDQELTGPAYDLLDDIAAVVSEPKLWSETVVVRLGELRPDAYGLWAAQAPEDRAARLTSALRPYGIRTGQVWGSTEDGKGANRRGITRDDITAAITERDGRQGPGTPR
jgi:S-DNA-T family DNA segregation ATPase FtsK/SpoIIIE